MRYSLVLCCGIVFASLFWAKQSIRQDEEYRVATGEVARARLVDPPEVSQQSIDTAILIFNIKVDHVCEPPVLDMDLGDRGFTTGILLRLPIIKVGPAAFESWALLGSTLAHEIEVHAHQDLVIISLLDRVGFDGIGYAEREAYRYEIKGQARFGLTDIEVRDINNTMNEYY